MKENAIFQEINDLLKGDEESLIETYTKVFDKAQSYYGKSILVLIEVGSFFEMYCPYTSGVLFEQLNNISKLLDVQLTRRNTKIEEIDIKNPYLLGFNVASKNKYIKKIMDIGKYNVLIITQKGNSKENNVSRSVEKVLSNGTSIDTPQEEENYIVSLMVEYDDGIYNLGCAYSDMRTGKNLVCEYYSSKEDPTKALDSFMFQIMSYNISNIIINLEKEIDEKFIIHYLDLKHTYTLKKEARKLEYQNQLLKKVFKLESFISPIEELGLTRFPLATHAYIFLCEHIIDYEENLLIDFPFPLISNDTNYLYIGNNGLEQLNVISNDGTSNLLTLLNKCTTSFGKRFFKERLLNPIKDYKELERRYSLSESFKENYEEIQKHLQGVYDLEKIARKIEINQLHPFELAQLYQSLRVIVKHPLLLGEEKNFVQIQTMISIIEKYFIISDCSRFNNDTISQNLIHTGIDGELDACVSEVTTIENELKAFVENVNTFYKTKDFLTLQYNDKEGFYFLVTKVRYKLMEKELDTHFFKLNGKNIFLNEFKYQTRTNNVKMVHNDIEKMSNSYLLSLNKIIIINKDYFKYKIKYLVGSYTKLIQSLVFHLSDIDIAVTNIKNSILFNYCKPTLLKNSEQKIEALALRHPLIEQKLEGTKFIPNDIVIGEISNEKLKCDYKINNNFLNGILLFGLNSSGKSSIQKALGLSLIMAQAGMYVPASSFSYTVYEQLFTRIVSKDNPDRGLSTFAVEMMELKNILMYGNKHSLVLGDEICHGTETVSGVSIVAAAIQYLSQKNINFIFATHLHQLVDLEEIKSIQNLVFLHLAILKDGETLVYDRKLKSGSGSSVYGLEFAKSLSMNKQFLKYADDILMKLDANHNNEIKSLTKNKNGSKYNSKMLETKCALCEQKAEYHHIQEQQNADDNNRINGLHKNHLSNLLPLCQYHHKLIHNLNLELEEGEELFKYTMTSKGLKLIINPLVMKSIQVNHPH